MSAHRLSGSAQKTTEILFESLAAISSKSMILKEFLFEWKKPE